MTLVTIHALLTLILGIAFVQSGGETDPEPCTGEDSEPDPDCLPGDGWATGFGMLAAIITLILSIPTLALGSIALHGVRTRQDWARTLSLTLGWTIFGIGILANVFGIPWIGLGLWIALSAQRLPKPVRPHPAPPVWP